MASLADAALDDFVGQEATLAAFVNRIAKSVDRALIKLGNASFYLTYYTVMRARAELMRSATSAAAYALDAGSLGQLAGFAAAFQQAVQNFLSQVRAAAAGVANSATGSCFDAVSCVYGRFSCASPQVLIVVHQSYLDYERDEVFQSALEDLGLSLPEFQVRFPIARLTPSASDCLLKSWPAGNALPAHLRSTESFESVHCNCTRVRGCGGCKHGPPRVSVSFRPRRRHREDAVAGIPLQTETQADSSAASVVIRAANVQVLRA